MNETVSAYLLRRAFPCEQREIKIALALGNDPVRCQAFACRNDHHHAGCQGFGIAPRCAAIVTDHKRAGCGIPEKRAHPVARAVSHHAIKPAACEEEEEQHHRTVEIGVRAVGDRFKQAKRRRKNNANRDWHIHVGALVAQRQPSRFEEWPSGIGDGRQCNHRREPVE